MIWFWFWMYVGIVCFIILAAIIETHRVNAWMKKRGRGESDEF